MSNNKRLTAKQEKFAQAIVDGYGQSEAYMLAYDTSDMLPATIHNSAYKLMRHGGIAARISGAREAVASELIPYSHLAQTSDAVNRQLSCFSSRYMNLLAVFQI